MTQCSHWNATSFAGLLWEIRLEEVLLHEDRRRSTPKSSTFLKTENVNEMKRLEEKPAEETIDLAESTPLIDQVCSGCTQRESASKESDVKIKSD